MRRYRVTMWGKGTLPRDFVARLRDEEPVLPAIGERIARRMGLRVCGGPRIDSESRPAAVVQVTLGRSLGRGQGYTDIREVWCSVREVTP